MTSNHTRPIFAENKDNKSSLQPARIWQVVVLHHGGLVSEEWRGLFVVVRLTHVMHGNNDDYATLYYPCDQ